MATSTIWRVPREIVRCGTALLDQQCFCFGEDIKRADGNLLLEYGFVRERHATEAGCSRYARVDAEGGVWTLWGFGLFRGVPGVGGLLLARAAFTARLAPSHCPPDAWNRRDVAIRYPTTPEDGEALRRLLRDSLEFLAAYEEWVAQRCESAWRPRCIARWHRQRLPGPMAPEWRRLAALLD